MKDWIKKLSDSEIEAALNINHEVPIPEDLDDRELYKFQHYSLPQIKRPIQFPFRMAFAFAAAFLVLIVFGINFLLPNQEQNTEMTTQSRVSFMGDKANLYRNNVLHSLDFNDSIIEGDRIKTSKISGIDIKLGENSTISLQESSHCILTKISEKTTTIDLLEGRVLADVNQPDPDSLFQIIAHDIKVSVVGTQFMVERTAEGITYVYVYRGTVKVDYSKEEFVSEGNYLKIEDKSASKEKLPESVKSVFQNYQRKQHIESDPSALINFSVKPEDVKVTLNGDDLFTIQSKVQFPIEAGKYEFVFQKEGYQSSSLMIDARSGEEYSKEIILQEEIQKSWQWKKIYSYKNKDKADYNNILGTISAEDTAVAYTQTALIGIQSNGAISWEKTYGQKEKIIFNSLPFIFKGKVYISSSNKQMLVLDNKTGKEIKRISTNGSINFNYSMMKQNNMLYIPYADGIYTYDLTSDSVSTSPIIPYNSPTIPVIDTKNIYTSSFLLKEIVCIEAKTNTIRWKYLLDDRGYSPLFKAGENMAVGDKAGNIYLFSASGKLLKKAILASGITSRLVGNNSSILCLANDGVLYKISLPNLAFDASFPIDSKADIPAYIYKYPVIQQNKVFIGTDKGDIMIIDLTKNLIEEQFHISNSAISCTISPLAESYIAGTKNGEIFLIEYK